jgi:hypothetical protein
MRALIPLLCAGALVAAETPAIPVPGTVVWSSIGNSIDARGGMRNAEWVQQMVDEVEVSPEGTLMATSWWDEQGRVIGLYNKAGRTHRAVIGQYNRKGGHNCWGYGTANKSAAMDGARFYCVNANNQLLRFDWKPGDVDSHNYRDQFEVGKESVGMGALNGVVVIVYADGSIERRLDSDLGTVTVTASVPKATDAAVAADGSVWLVVDGAVVEYDAQLKPTGRKVPETLPQWSVNVAPDGRLVVCDNNPRQQVRLYKAGAKGAVTLDSVIGQAGGFAAGTPGQPAPDKFAGLRGANLDAEGNLFVAMCFAEDSEGSCILRSFTPKGDQRWELLGLPFNERMALEPGPGNTIRAVGKVANLLVDPDTRAWSVESFTYDTSGALDPDRLKRCGVQVRTINGQKFSFTDHMVGDKGYAIFAQPKGVGFAPRVGEVGGDVADSWTWSLDSAANLWSVAPDRTIRMTPVGSLVAGCPTYDAAKATSWPVPEGWGEICRIQYVPATDSLYIAGYPAGTASKNWGLIGSALARYDGWTAGKPVRAWMNTTLPEDNEGYPPKSIEICGDYAFTVGTRERSGCRAVVEAISTTTGKSVGSLIPAKDVGNGSGWIDIRTGITALKTRDGRYHLAIEDNNGIRNHFVTWTPGK